MALTDHLQTCHLQAHHGGTVTAQPDRTDDLAHFDDGLPFHGITQPSLQGTEMGCKDLYRPRVFLVQRASRFGIGWECIPSAAWGRISVGGHLTTSQIGPTLGRTA